MTDRRILELIRRPNARFRETNGVSIPYFPLTLNPIRWLEASAQYVTIDGSDDVTTWADQSPSNVPMEGIGSKPTYISSDPNLNDQGSIDFAASANEFLRESIIHADLKCLHDGTGGTFIAVVDTDGADAQQTLYSTSSNFTAVSTGFFVRYTGSGWRAAIMKGSSPFVADRTGVITGGEKGVLVIRMKSGESPEFNMRWNGVQIASDPTFDTTPSTGNPADVARMGTNTSVTQAFDGRVSVIGVFPYLSLSDVTALEVFLSTKYGL